jgi:hypothetical protein
MAPNSQPPEIPGVTPKSEEIGVTVAAPDEELEIPKVPEPPKMPTVPPIPTATKAPVVPQMPKAPEPPAMPHIPAMPSAAPGRGEQDVRTIAMDYSDIPQVAEPPKPAVIPGAAAPEEKVPTPYLLRKKTDEKIYITKDEFSIGKSSTKADYTVTDNSAVSRIHCIIYRRNGVSYIKDNNSTNGTYINDEELAAGTEKFLTNKAVVTLGDEDFVYFVR